MCRDSVLCFQPALYPSRSLHPAQVFLFGRRVLGLARVVGWVRNRTGDGGVEVILRHYQKPEETHVGRQVRWAELWARGTGATMGQRGSGRDELPAEGAGCFPCA